MQGFVMLHREIQTSPTFQTLTLAQKMITIYLILNANHTDGIWTDNRKGLQVKIGRGQLITSAQKIADEWFKSDKEITRQVVRTTLVKLEKLHFLTKQSTNDYTLINVVNYSVYQSSNDDANQATNQALTKSQPSPNQALTTNNNVKNVKNEKNKEKELKDIPPKSATSEIDFENANLLFELMQENYPDAKKPNFEKWTNHFRLLREKDGALDKEVKYIIAWSQKSTFWKGNIRSPDKFRKQYPTLHIQAREEVQRQKIVSINKPKHDFEGLKEHYRNQELEQRQ